MTESADANALVLSDLLEQARARGFLGPGPVAEHLEHADRFRRAAGSPSPARALDLGSGGGVPGLALALAWPSSQWVLLDASLRRTNFLGDAVGRLGLADRVNVVRGRAEDLAHDPEFRNHHDLVVARSFGQPAVVAECGAAFLVRGGRLVVSEPPGSTGERWPSQALIALGLGPARVRDGCAVMVRGSPCPDRFPRRTGVPAKRPLF